HVCVLPSLVDRFIGEKKEGPILSNTVCRACQIARSCTLIGCRGWFCDGLVATSETMRSPSGNGSPLKRPPLTTQKTVVLRPSPSPSVRMATSDSVGYLISIRTPE